MENIQIKYFWRRQKNKERIHEIIQKNLLRKCVEEKRGDQKSVEIDWITDSIKTKIESIPDPEVCTDVYDSTEVTINRFRWSVYN